MRSRDDSLRGSSCAFGGGQSSVAHRRSIIRAEDLKTMIYRRKEKCVYTSPRQLLDDIVEFLVNR